ncbi:hypothetical protein ES705_28619 [subsurface metagenome]|nr:hypothetical protein [Methanosarcinales archaeon]
MTEFVKTPEFSNDLKKIYKRFKSIYKDLQRFKNALELELPKRLSGTVRISRLGHDVKVPIYKVRHFRCQSLKGKGSRSGIRIIYAYEQDEDKVTLIEIYHKNKKENEDRDRILNYFT